MTPGGQGPLVSKQVLLADSWNPESSEKLDVIGNWFTAEGFEFFRVMIRDVYGPRSATTAA